MESLLKGKEYTQMVLILNPYLSLVSLQQLVVCFFDWRIIALQGCAGFPIQQHESAVNILHIHPLPPESPCKPLSPSHHSRSSQSTGLSSLYYSNSPLPIYFTYGDVYISMPLNSSHPLLPRVCLQVHSLHLHLFSCPEIHQYAFSRFHINALIYNICFSLSGILHSVLQALGSSTAVQLTQIHSWVIFYCIYVC